MEIIGGKNIATIDYNDNLAKSNGLSLVVIEGMSAANVKFDLEASTAGEDGEGNKVFGRGEYITYIINIDNFNTEQLTGFKAPVSGWNFTIAIPVAFQIPEGLMVVDYTNASVPELSENPYITYTQDGVTTKMKRIIDSSKYVNGSMYGYQMINNLCTMLLPKIDAQSSSYITVVVEKNAEIALGTQLPATVTLDFTENDNLDEQEKRIPIRSNEVTVKYAFAEVTAEKKGPESAVSYDTEFSYDIIMTNNGNLPAKISKIADTLPDRFTVSQDADSVYKISVKHGATPLVKDTDFNLNVTSTAVEITPVEEGKLDIEGEGTVTVTITGKIAKSTP